jgi:streptogramin lyase
MTVTVTTANGATPSVVISGPNGYTKTVTSTQTITGLAVGNYVIVADSAVTPDSVVGSIVDTGAVTGSPASVTANATAAASVKYALKYRVGGMWIANNNNGTNPELGTLQLRAGGTITPAETLFTQVNGPAGLAIDAHGTMWESAFDDDVLLGYTPADRNAGGSTMPTFTITSSSIQDAECLAVDGHGNLWVADRSAGLLEFTPSQLAATGTQTASVVIAPGSVLKTAEALAFDSLGDAWVADEGADHIVEFSAAQLASSAAPTPADTINTGAATEAVAFDASGNLWVASDAPALLEYTPAQLAAGGAPNPTVTISLPSGTHPFGMAIDNRGTVWISDVDNDVMLGLTAAQLAATGSPTPAVTDTLDMSASFGPEQPVLDPYATAITVGAAKVGRHVSGTGRIHRVNPNAQRLAIKR